MANRTPSTQGRSQFHRDWGNYTDPGTALPNQSGNVLTGADFNKLEPGDIAYASGTRYTCLDVGTDGGGNAVWWDYAQAALPVSRGFLAGATAADRRYWLRAGADPFAGQVQWAIGAIWQPIAPAGAEQIICATSPQFVNTGFRLTWDGGTINFRWRDSAATLQTVSVFEPDFFGKTLYAIVRYVDGGVQMWINNTFGAFFGGPAGAYTTGGGFAIGASSDGLENAAVDAGVHGAWILPDYLLTDSDSFNFFRESFARGSLVLPDAFSDPSLELWRAYNGNPLGGTWVASEGANDLAETGTGGSGLVTGYEPRIWAGR